ncbi:DUF3499 family protein [Humidisolicoccus flavus]|uniref:DUF3499 family protein n=1 Tax=Humidisolicoccus flavus TaxID=3111414 RepID=UPI0032554360
MDPRPCTKATCRHFAERTLTYDYGARLVVIGPLAPERNGGYDLCSVHADRISTPKDWQIIRHQDAPQ